jgi:hypothetical protein
MNDDNLIRRPAPDLDQPVDNSLTEGGAKSDTADQASQNTTSIPIPPEAEDSDLIEKEWVERAKQIVAHTRHDPHEQQKALSLMKADYMKKRYNRDVKVSKRDLEELKPDSED